MAFTVNWPGSLGSLSVPPKKWEHWQKGTFLNDNFLKGCVSVLKIGWLIIYCFSKGFKVFWGKSPWNLGFHDPNTSSTTCGESRLWWDGIGWDTQHVFFQISGQIAATSRDLTPKSSWGREIPLFQNNLGWQIITIWPMYCPRSLSATLAWKSYDLLLSFLWHGNFSVGELLVLGSVIFIHIGIYR